MPNFEKIQWLLFLSLPIFSVQSFCSSLLSIPAFVSAKEVSIEILVGDAIDATGNNRKKLFHDQRGREAAFISKLTEKISNRLKESSLMVDSDANSTIVISIYGHQIPNHESIINRVFYFEVHLWDDTDKDEVTEPTRSWGKLGAVSDADLENTIIEAILTGLDSHLKYRSSVLDYFQKKASEEE